MKILYIGIDGVIARHELGFIASLKSLGRVDLLIIDPDISVEEKLRIVSDNGFTEVSIFKINIDITKFINIDSYLKIRKIAPAFREYLESYDIIFTNPRESLLLSFIINKDIKFPPVVLRLPGIRAAKLKDNLRFKAYSDIALFLPSIIANCFYIASSNVSIALDYATYSFAKHAYPFYAKKLYKVYPPYGYLYTTGNSQENDEKVLQLIDSIEDYILGFTSLNKRGSYLKFEAKPHALLLYNLARKMKNINVVLAGSSYNDWIGVFPKITPPSNLYFTGRGFSDRVLHKLYGKAKLVIVPITNRSISNRLLEALFFSKPIVTSEIVNLIHPELKHMNCVYISHCNNIIDGVSRIIKNDSLLRELEVRAKEVYLKYFSTKINLLYISKLLEAQKEK